ncbi:MAG: PQQ-binding-like beta-propeller repeat protein [Verrucomicrobiales bacterium]
MKTCGNVQQGGRSLLRGFQSIIIASILMGSLPAFANSLKEKPKSSVSSTRYIASPEKGWPQFRGPKRNGVSEEKGLLQTWPQGGPSLIWKSGNLGRGFSSPIIADEKIFITGDVEDDLVVFCLDIKGKILWQSKNGKFWRDPYPGARGTPAYSNGKVYHQNAHGRLVCLNAADGKELWNVELLQDFKGKNITWGLSEGVLVDETAVYATAGGADALVVALDKNSGKVIWKSKPLQDSAGAKEIENPSYVSPILVEFAGQRLLIGCSLKHLYCLDASNGKLHWTERFPTSYNVLAMQPLLVRDAVFMTAPHGRGGRLLRMVKPESSGGKITVEEVWRTTLDTAQGGTVFVDNKILGSFYPGRKGWGAVDADTGKILYQADAYVKGAAIYADHRFYALSEDGWMRLLEPTENEFKPHGEFRLAQAENDAWAHPVLFNGRLYLRYHDTLFCYDVKGGE